jgi:signal transduction histidine kinase
MPTDAPDDFPLESWPARRVWGILDGLVEGFQIIGFDWRYLYVNEAACRHGRRARGELLGVTMTEAYPGIQDAPLFATLEAVMVERVTRQIENLFEYADGSSAWFELRVEPVPEGILVLSMDIDDRKAIEAQFRQSQKMEAVGRLAGGVAHDFNNLLTAIRNFGDLVLERLDSRDPVYEDMREVLLAAGRGEELVRQLLAFSRKQLIEPRFVDVNELVRKLDAMLRRLLGEDVRFRTTLGADLWTAWIDPGAFEQVLVNLAVNARDAMPRGGKLTIETANVVLDEGYRMTKGGVVRPGDYVVLAVSDDGSGMDAATREQIFEPFFTTKDVDKGTGLGLSTCYGIVKQAGGYLWVYSEPGAGSTFKIYLPRMDADARPADDKPRSEGPRSEAATPLATETVLVVEDDDQVRRLVVRLLVRVGYTLLEAPEAVEALRLADETEGPIHLLLTDVVMPGMSGQELARRFRDIRPDARVLFMSGYTEHAVAHQETLEPDSALIQKPFTMDGLARRVREILDA